MSIRVSLYFLVVFLLFLISACSNQEGGGSTSTFREESAVQVEPINEAGFRDLVQNRNGKILLLNFWATWCIPCREEFPDLVKIANKYQGENMEVVGISADFPDEIESKVKPFLKSQNANFKNYVKNVEDDEALINSMNPDWSGALPATFIYDVNGVLRQSHFGQNDFNGFRKMIEVAETP
jgi:thiol-disulfide isomerase/thioredoxin